MYLNVLLATVNLLLHHPVYKITDHEEKQTSKCGIQKSCVGDKIVEDDDTTKYLGQVSKLSLRRDLLLKLRHLESEAVTKHLRLSSKSCLKLHF